MYDGFISYSHAADDLLAPRLQAGLQRFAKPWWKRRAVRIFRDEASLAANPHLWSSITEALNDSAWFVLLLSPDAASSEWVGKEIEHWVEHKDPDRILPVVTDGTFTWTDGDVAGSSVPPALRGVFSEEPRWVDLRFAKGDENLDLKNPEFSSAVADIASAIRGIPKDELAGEEVRQHRRTVRTAWAAGITLAVLAIAAVVAGVFAIEQRNEAQDAQTLAEAESTRANTEADRANTLADQEAAARAEAEANATEADIQRAAAVVQAAISRSRELSASAIAVLDEDPELSVMLALESIEATPPGSEPSPEGVRTLREAILSNRLVARFDSAGPYARIAPNGSVMYHSDVDANTLVAVGIETGEEIWTSDRIPVGDVGRVEISPDGAMVSVQVHEPGNHAVLVFDASDGEPVVTLDPGQGCAGTDIEGLSAIGGFSPGGQWFSVFTGRAGCGEVPGEGWISVYDTSTWEETFKLNTEDGLAFSSYFSTDSSRVLLTSHGGTAELLSFPDLELINTFNQVFTAASLSPDGTRVATIEGPRGPILADAETGNLISSLSHAAEVFAFVEPFVFSPDGSKLVVGARNRDYLFDGFDGGYKGALATGQTVSSSFTADGSRLLTTTLGTPLIWNLATGHPIANDDFSGDWINPEQATSGPLIAVNVFDFEGAPQVLAVIDPVSGVVLDSRSAWGSQLPDGRFVVVRIEGDWGSYTVGPLEIWDPADGSSTVLAGCVGSFGDSVEEPGVECPDGEMFFAGGEFGDPFVAVVAADGSVFATQATDEEKSVVVWDAASLLPLSDFPIPSSQTLVGMTDGWVAAYGESSQSGTESLNVYNLVGDVVATIDPAAATGAPFTGSVEFVDDASLLFVRDAAGTVLVYDTTSWGLQSQWPAHDGVIRGWEFSDDRQRLATAGEEDFIHVWDLGPVFEGGIPDAPEAVIATTSRPSDVVWLSDEEIAVFLIDRGTGATWFSVLLEAQQLVSDARSRLTRGFTAGECATYQIDDCPMTLMEIQGG
jgi:WD40 repeat protein